MSPGGELQGKPSGGWGGVVPGVWEVGLMAGPCVESSELEISISPASK